MLLHIRRLRMIWQLLLLIEQFLAELGHHLVLLRELMEEFAHFHLLLVELLLNVRLIFWILDQMVIFVAFIAVCIGLQLILRK